MTLNKEQENCTKAILYTRTMQYFQAHMHFFVCDLCVQ